MRLAVSKLRLGFLASHGGSNVQAIIDACKGGSLDAEPCVVISNNSDSEVLRRAAREGVPNLHLSSGTHPRPRDLDAAITATLESHGVNLVVLAGYMRLLGPQTVARYRGRILNVHPALLPAHGGKGMYGERVHAAVLAARERVTGVTVHLVDKEYDQGPVVAQTEVPVLEDDTVESLRERVLRREHEFYVETLKRIAIGEIELPGQPSVGKET